eukprot:3122940-Rhodomonas_salina.4
MWTASGVRSSCNWCISSSRMLYIAGGAPSSTTPMSTAISSSDARNTPRDARSERAESYSLYKSQKRSVQTQ